MSHPKDSQLITQYPASTPKVVQFELEMGVFVHLEEYGNPGGIPVVFVHGGPGTRFRKADHQWFNPEKYRIVLFQQRGTWGCTPSAEDLGTDAVVFQGVTIQTLADDMEVIRKALGIDQWLVFGGSWGSTLSLYYAEEYPKSCRGLVLRGVYLATEEENRDFFDPAFLEKQCGAEWEPKALERMIEYATSHGQKFDPEKPTTLLTAYRNLIISQNDIQACRLWRAFEDFVDEPSNKDHLERLLSDSLETTPTERSVGVWETLMFDVLPKSINLLDEDRIARLRDMPIQIVHGAKDNVCPRKNSQKLVDKLKETGNSVRLDLIENGAHTPYHPEMTHALVSATDRFAEKGEF